MSARAGEDVREQRARMNEALAELEDALTEAAALAKAASRTARSRKGLPDLTPLHAAMRLVIQAEENADFAALDLATAGGEHA